MALSLAPLDPLGDDRTDLTRFLTENVFPFHVHSRWTQAEAEAAIDSGAWEDGDTESFWIVDTEHGRVGVLRLDDLADTTAMFDLRLGEPWRGRGIGSQALHLATARVFAAGAHVLRFEGHTREDNVAMRRTFARCGWVQEAHYRDGWPVRGGEPVASVAYSVLRRDHARGVTTPVPPFFGAE